MRFTLIDTVIEQTDDRIVARKLVTRAEEYLGDHFPAFPVLPGVMMVETMVQAARRLLAGRDPGPLVLGQVKALKFGSMVRPGETLEVEVSLTKTLDGGRFSCRGTGRVLRASERASEGHADPDVGETVANGRFTMRPLQSVPCPT